MVGTFKKFLEAFIACACRPSSRLDSVKVHDICKLKSSGSTSLAIYFSSFFKLRNTSTSMFTQLGVAPKDIGFLGVKTS